MVHETNAHESHAARARVVHVVAHGQSFRGWTETFTDPRLCAAIIDRLTFNDTIIETDTQSYRLNHTRSTLG